MVRSPSRLARLTSPGGLFLSAALLICALPAISPLRDPDFWWHLRAGQLIIQHRGLLGTDPFTYTVADHQWTMHEWLTEVGFAALHAAGGIGLIVVVLSIVTWLGMLTIAARAWIFRPRPIALGSGMLLGAAVGYPIWGPRAQMITFAFTCAVLWLVERDLTRGGRAIWGLVPITLVWSNLHSGFIIGLGLVAAILIAELVGSRLGIPDPAPNARLGRLLVVLAVATLAGLINLNGPGILLYPLATQGSAIQQAVIEEWHSPDFHLWEIHAYELMLLSLAVMVVVNRRISARDAAIALTVTVLSLQSTRHIALFVAGATPIWIVQANRLLSRRADRRHHRQTAPRLNPPIQPQPAVDRRPVVPPPALPLRLTVPGFAIVIAGLLSVVGARLHMAASVAEDSRFYARDYPVCAAQWLARVPPPVNIFNQYGEGGYLAYRLSSLGDHVYIFGDAALMGDRLLADYSAVDTVSSRWNAVLRNARTDLVAFDVNTPLVNVMERSSRWVEVYRDPLTEIFAPTDRVAGMQLPTMTTSTTAACNGSPVAGT